MRTLIQDLRHGFRVSRRSPGFTLVAVLTLAIGIAANTTVFTWINSVLVHPIPGTNDGPDLVVLETVAPNGDYLTTSYPDYLDYRRNLKLLEGLAVSRFDQLSIGEGEQTERARGELVSGNFFNVLGVKPAAGRFFSADEDSVKQGAHPVAVISDGLWRRRFQADPGVVGTQVRINRVPMTIIGVAPREFRGSIPGLAFDIWAPLTMAVQMNVMPEWMPKDRKSRILFPIARIKPGVTIERARAEVASVAKELAAMDPYTNGGISATLFPVWQGHFGAQNLLLAPLRILMAVCAVVLLIVCANVANLLLARSTIRQREFSVRVALGAGRGRMVRQLLTETLLLAVMGAVVAVPLTMWMGQALGYLLPRTNIPLSLDIRMNGDILAFTILICVLAAIVSGIAPAWHTSRANLNDVLKEGGRSGASGAASQRMRGLLVVSEVALALLATIGAGLFFKSFQIARHIHPGFDAQNVLVSHLYLSSAGYSVPDRKIFCERLRERLEAQPGVANVSYADQVPLGFAGGSWEDLQIEGYQPGPGENMKLYRNVVAPGYFDLLRIPVLEGRDFTEQDVEASNRVMIVTEAFARRFFPGKSVIGRKVRGWGQWFTITGVVKDSKYHLPNEAPMPHFYVPFRQVYRADMTIAFYVRTPGDPNQFLAAMRQEVRSLDPNVAMMDAMPLAEFIQASLFAQKTAATMLTVLGLIALLLASVGLYSVMAYSITQRTQEVGIRMALGAQPGDVLSLVIRQGMSMALTGLALGVVAALIVTRLAGGLLVQVSATDPLVFGGASLFLATVALAASYIPARRATRIDPTTALRCQ